MWSDELTFLWRVINIVGSLISIPSLYFLTKRNRGVISRRAMSLMQALIVAHLGILSASMESILRHEPLLPRTALWSVVVGWTLLSLYFPKALTRDEEIRKYPHRS